MQSAAQDRAAVERQFRAWLEESVWPRARAEGVSRDTFDAAFAGVTLDWDLPDLVPPGTQAATPRRQRQAEFGSPARYFSRGAVDGATTVGRQMNARHAATLADVERATGVPGRIVLAIWGRESGYGRVAIPHDAFEVLGTKGFMSTRADYFTDELIAALQIAEAGHAPGRAMKSSWAGALGQPQFMPSSFLALRRRRRRRRPRRHLAVGGRHHRLDRHLPRPARLGGGTRLGLRGRPSRRRLLHAGRPRPGPPDRRVGGARASPASPADRSPSTSGGARATC